MNDSILFLGIESMILIKLMCVIGFISIFFLVFGIMNDILLYIGKILILLSLSIGIVLVFYLVIDFFTLSVNSLLSINIGKEITYSLSLLFGIYAIYGTGKFVMEY